MDKPKREYHIVDYKATSTVKEIDLNDQWKKGIKSRRNSIKAPARAEFRRQRYRLFRVCQCLQRPGSV